MKRLYFLIAVGAANLILLLTPLQPIGAVLLALILPGWGWALVLAPRRGRLAQFALAAGLSYALTAVGMLLLHALPGPVLTWHLLAWLNLAALLPLAFGNFPAANWKTEFRQPAILILGGLLLPALFLRFANLGYSEFQGDEALAMITAAEMLEGHEDALFLRGKGPAEVLFPAALWRLSGPITEGIARLPFAVAGMMAVVTLYLLAEELLSTRNALFAAAFLAAAGLMVGFSRIVQYQTLVIWFSALSLWSLWQWRETNQLRWAGLAGLFLGVGLLAHYDAILVLPALGWVWLTAVKPPRRWLTPGVFLAVFTAAAGLFYLPYLLDPQISRTGSYLGDRIGAGGAWLKNNLGDFLHFNSFYSSFYYVLVVGLLAVGFFGWAIYHYRRSRLPGAIIAVAALLIPLLLPNLPGAWAFGPMALVMAAAFFSPALNRAHQTALLWFAAPFLGYNFGVAMPLTHIYTVLPGLALLAGFSTAQIKLNRRALALVGGVALALSTLYLWNAFVRHDVEFLQDYPAANLPFFVTPYADPPQTGFFGFAHKSGWKMAGALITAGALNGDYGSNEEEDVTSWYTRHTPRACNPGAEFYFVAADVVDAVKSPEDELADRYSLIGRAGLPNGKNLSIYQRTPPTLNPGELDVAALERRFDAGATPDAFTRTPVWAVAANANFGGQIRLAGYTLNTQRAYPGGRIVLTLYWQALTDIKTGYKVFVHLDSDKKYAQADSVPVCARYPTADWRPGQIIADQHALELAAEIPAGNIPLVVGLYQPETGQRLDLLDEAGNPAGVSLTLAEVIVSERQTTNDKWQMANGK